MEAIGRNGSISSWPELEPNFLFHMSHICTSLNFIRAADVSFVIKMKISKSDWRFNRYRCVFYIRSFFVRLSYTSIHHVVAKKNMF